MAEWKKIIVSGSDAHLNAVTASSDVPLIFTGNVTGSTSTIPLVLDSTGRVATGSAYAVQGGTDYVSGEELTSNHVIVGNGGSSIKVANSSISFAGQPVTTIGSVTFNAGANVGGSDTTFFNNHIAIDNNAAKNQGDIVLKYADLEFRDSTGLANTASISSSISTLFLYGDNQRTTPVIKWHAADAETTLTDRMIFEGSVSHRNYAIQVKPSSIAAKAEFALVNGTSDKVIHVSGSRVGIGTLATKDSGLTFAGGVSGSGGAYIKDIHTDAALDTTSIFTKTLVYDSATGRIAAESSNNLGGITGITAGTNINTSGAGNVTINVDSSLNDITGIKAGTISGSGIVLRGGSGSFGEDGIERYDDGSRVSVQHVTASNLIVQDSSIFNGTFLFSGFDFQVQNASTFSGSNQFGSGSVPGLTFHEFTGSVDITGSLTATGPVDFNNNVNIDGTLTLGGNADFNGDLDVDGTTNLDVVDIDGAVDMASTLTLADDADFNGRLDVAGAITGSTLQLTGLGITTTLSDTNFLVISGSDNNVFEASLGTLTLDDISTSAGPGIFINGSTISVNSGSMANFFASESFRNVDGDVTFNNDGDGTFTSVLNDNTVEANNIDFFYDTTDDGLSNGEILVVSQSSGTTKFAKKAISGVITIDQEGVTAFTEAAGIDSANNASASLISSASAGDHSIILTNTTNGGVTQSLLVDGTSGNFKYNTATNILTVGGTHIGNDVVVQGNLSVGGTTTTVNSETITVADNFIELNSNLTSNDVTSPTGPAEGNDTGISINRGNQATASLFWDESANRWALSQDDTSTAGAQTLNPDAYLMYVYTTNGAAPPVHQEGIDNTPEWEGYGGGATATKQGAVYIDSVGDIFIYV